MRATSKIVLARPNVCGYKRDMTDADMDALFADLLAEEAAADGAPAGPSLEEEIAAWFVAHRCPDCNGHGAVYYRHRVGRHHCISSRPCACGTGYTAEIPAGYFASRPKNKTLTRRFR